MHALESIWSGGGFNSGHSCLSDSYFIALHHSHFQKPLIGVHTLWTERRVGLSCLATQ